MLRSALFAVSIIVGAPADAQAPMNTQTVSWVAPTQYTDGTTIPSTVVLTYNVYAKFGTAAEVKYRSAMTGTTITPNLPVGQNNCYTVTVLVNGANESARSAEACGVVRGLATKPVTTIVIQ